jgi:exopolyphosphatase/pppGpp-phosphohydrolase
VQVFRIPTQQTMTPSLPDADFTEALLQSYGAARQLAGDQVCIVALHIGGQNSGIAVGTGMQPELVKSLPLGAERTTREQFRTAPPTPLAMENAIQVVEDVVMPLRAVIPREALLFSTDASVREIARLSGDAAAEPLSLSLEAMERVFNRLSAVVEGSSAAHQGLPESNHFAATLLILREFMHHLQFAHIVVLHAQ